MKKAIRAFTINELLVVIAILGILATIGVVSFSRYQSYARDKQRSSSVTIIAEALEKYYDQNGEYPSCDAMSADPSIVTTNTLLNMDPDVLAAPRANIGTNSILSLCEDLTAGSNSFAYVGVICNEQRCQQYTLKYREENTSIVVSIPSRHFAQALNAPTFLMGFVASSTQINMSWMSVEGATSYTIQRDTDMAFSNPTINTQSGVLFASTGLSQATKYYYRVLATGPGGDSNWSTVADATTTLDAPESTPIVTASTVSYTTTWSWPSVTASCASGTAARYQYRYTIETVGYDSGWTEPNNPEALSIAFTTSTEGYTYTVYIQAQCFVNDISSVWGTAGSDDYYRPMTVPSLTATAISSSAINLSWSSVAGSTSYELQRDTNSLFTTATTIATQAGTTFSSTGLSSGITYYYRVNQTGEGGTSDWSTTANDTTTIDAPSAPTVTANTVTTTTTWSWTTPTCTTGTVRYQYKYTISPSGYDSGWVAIASSPVAFTTSPEMYTYTVQIQAQCYNANTASTWSSSGQASYYRPMACPSGFIPVPGSATYSTSNFCVMKYEAKQVGATTVPISLATGTPWTNITQTAAIANSPNVAGCTGCHLITEAEWMTIAQNVLGVASNWSSGIVGTGYIFSGHNDNVPANSLAADVSDANGYSGTGNSAPSNQRRTLTLSNGEVIWDMAGNVDDWTSGTVTTGQPGIAGNAYASWINWPNVTTQGTLTPSVFPSGTGITGASNWTSTNGIGQLLSNPAETGLRSFLRGSDYSHYGASGILALNLGNTPGSSLSGSGFRVSGNKDPNWIAGIAGTVLENKYVRNVDLGSTYQYKTTNTAVASPHGLTGLDPSWPSNKSLVSPQSNPAVDFSTYPAQNACKAVGGRLPNMSELWAIKAGRTTYGNNLQIGGYYVSATEQAITAVYGVPEDSPPGGYYYGLKANYAYVRCVTG